LPALCGEQGLELGDQGNRTSRCRKFRLKTIGTNRLQLSLTAYRFKSSEEISVAATS
jgi:hypothetical protein